MKLYKILRIYLSRYFNPVGLTPSAFEFFVLDNKVDSSQNEIRLTLRFINGNMYNFASFEKFYAKFLAEKLNTKNCSFGFLLKLLFQFK